MQPLSVLSPCLSPLNVLDEFELLDDIGIIGLNEEVDVSPPCTLNN
jgi:hypothetical protein